MIILDIEPSGISDDLVKDIFGTMARVLSYETTNLISGTSKNGWVCGGSESWYQVARVKTGVISSKLVAMKSIVSLGDIHEKALEEANRLAIIGVDFAPEVYAVTRASIIKEFLKVDDYLIPKSDFSRQLTTLNRQLERHGLWIQGGLTALANHVIQTDGRVKLIDAGTGDISGTASI